MSMTAKFDLANEKEFGDTLKKLRKAVSADQLETAGIAGAMIVVNDAKRRVVKKTRTLSRSIHQMTEKKSKSKVVILIGSDLDYAPVHEFGATIKPKRAKALHFKIDGRWVTASMVHIPARPYLRPALHENTDRVWSEIISSLNQLLASAGA